MAIEIQMIPTVCKKWNLHSSEHPLIPLEKWKDISFTVREREKKCHYCQREFPLSELDAHEVWDFDMKRHIQRLVGIVSACKMCHRAVHFDNLFKEEKYIYLSYISAINQKYYTDVKESVDEAEKLWNEQNKIEDWELDISFIIRRGYAVASDISLKELNSFAPGSKHFLEGLANQSDIGQIELLQAEIQKLTEKFKASVDIMKQIIEKRIQLAALIKYECGISVLEEELRNPSVLLKAVFGVLPPKKLDESLKKELGEALQAIFKDEFKPQMEEIIKEALKTSMKVSQQEAFKAANEVRQREELKAETKASQQEAVPKYIEKPMIYINDIPEKYIIYEPEPISYGGICQICGGSCERLYLNWHFQINSDEYYEDAGTKYFHMRYLGRNIICSLCRDTIYNSRKKHFRMHQKSTRRYQFLREQATHRKLTDQEIKQNLRVIDSQYTIYKYNKVYIDIPVGKIPKQFGSIVRQWIEDNGASLSLSRNYCRLCPSGNLDRFKEFFIYAEEQQQRDQI